MSPLRTADPAAKAGVDAPAAGMSSEQPYLEFRNLTKVYATDDGPVRALDRISVDQRQGEFLSILGPSGCGKSTLLMIAAGLLSGSDGLVAVRGQRVDAPRTDIGIVFQSPVLLEWRTALGNVMLQAEARNFDLKSAEQRARELLAVVGLSGFENKYPDELSGGMRQRVSICRALIHNPPQLLMDEPFGALDALTRDQLGLDVQRLWDETRMTVLFVTHRSWNPNSSARWATCRTTASGIGSVDRWGKDIPNATASFSAIQRVSIIAANVCTAILPSRTTNVSVPR